MSTELPRASLWYTEVQNLHSTIMGCDYQISTWFPTGYPQPDIHYPVIYMTDPELHLGFISTMIQGFMWDGKMPAAIMVGVGRQGISTFEEWSNARDIDMAPPEDPDVATQKRAADYLSFFRKELIPFVETIYPVNPGDRCLAGFSRGGEFTLFALLHDPELFQRYFVGSGIWKSMLPHYLSYEEQLAEQRKSLPVHAFFSVGSLEDDKVPYFHQFIDVLRHRNYAGLCLDTLIVEGENHLTSGPTAWSRGMRALYKP